MLATPDELALILQRDLDLDTANLVLELASATVEEFCGRLFLTDDYVTTFEADKLGSITPPNTPVTAVTLIEAVEDIEGVKTYTAAEGWWLELNRIFGLFDCWEYRVTYTAGYATVPAVVKGVVLSVAARSYSAGAAGPYGARSVTLGDWSVAFGSDHAPGTLTKSEQKALRRYRRPAAGYGTLEVDIQPLFTGPVF